ncbi:hypothetical protein PN498_17730 [Oscillatoria sp. CS-180]|uniref:hypothetical protein n=1 Tax=Oscillatoria sp. CS-180 TaxID=3021720 RepID=UPI00233001AA|nr:hypothetical protein [Oscillatoria sp. CS-180]MDB9527840.1 hypothetical protein [Oscillatoria sp. CS-180]
MTTTILETPTPFAQDRAAHQRRLRESVKRLVIELGYLEHCLTEGLQVPNVQTAAAGIDTAINCLNEHLAE